MHRTAAWWIALVVGGCGFVDPLDSVQRAVVGGVPAEDDPGVVLVVIPGGTGCSGTAISERVVLTAKHCTQGTGASEWRVLVGPAPLTLEGREAEYLVDEIRTTPGSGTGVGEDLAVMLLHSDFGFSTYRWAFVGQDSVVTGAPVRHVGFGMTVAGDGSSAGSRNMRAGSLAEVYSQSLNAGVGACSGDSGGPLFDADDTMLGVAHDILEASCEGQARFTRLEPWFDLIAGALSDTGGCIPEAWTDTCGDGVDNDCSGVADDGCDPPDAGVDAGADSGADTGVDAGSDAGSDANPDAGIDAGGDAGDPEGTADDGDGIPDGQTIDADQKPIGKVKGSCSSGGTPAAGGTILALLAGLFVLGRARN